MKEGQLLILKVSKLNDRARLFPPRDELIDETHRAHDAKADTIEELCCEKLLSEFDQGCEQRGVSRDSAEDIPVRVMWAAAAHVQNSDVGLCMCASGWSQQVRNKNAQKKTWAIWGG